MTVFNDSCEATKNKKLFSAFMLHVTLRRINSDSISRVKNRLLINTIFKNFCTIQFTCALL